ncbi:NAD(P)-binding protein [Piromyces finnis]|uniref:NAD(P)-binding protein n=1 Tax=Piromyces finnis TaxID=1754191 RepID=A0A1Y1V3Q5_9FUNG|nr:NAD(P)-binding protein [Piromyces finnis]|eukprot:ORX45968.1 NAD(P)-binding protein [Piromyces finnis]
MGDFKDAIIKRQMFFSEWDFLPSYLAIYVLSIFELFYNLINNIFGLSKKDKVENLIQEIKNDISDEKQNRKTVVITGGTSGIGKETVISLAKANYIIYIGDKIEEEKINEIQFNLRKESRNEDIYLEYIDLSRIDSINSFVEKVKKNNEKIDILICNAGIMNIPYQIDEKGFEMQTSVNYFGHYKLIHLFIENLKTSKGKIIIVSSVVHYQVKEIDVEAFKSREKYRKLGNYALSKICLMMLMKDLDEKYSSSGVQVYSVHPGVVCTSLYQYDFLSNFFVTNFPIALKTPKDGSLTSIYLALEKSENLKSGKYYFECDAIPYNPLIDNKDVRNKLMEYTKSLNL